ncbi:hypothetical protein V3C99_002070 [Haemonchus contortus]
MRPTADVLNEFYDLVELDAGKRFSAADRLVSKVKSDSSIVDYCIERLVAGLSSPRGAARFGYSAALAVLLSEVCESWTVERLYELADKKLDLHDKENEGANGIGRHLLAYAIFQSKAYAECEALLIEKELEVYRAHPSLGMSIVQVIAEITVEMEKKKFKSTVLPLLKSYLDTAITRTSVEFLYLALLLKDRFPSYMSNSVSFIQKDGSCEFTANDFTFLLLIVKKCDSTTLAPLLNTLLTSARASGQFSDVYSNVVEKWCTSGDESKVLERIFNTVKLTLSAGDTTHKDILAVFSPALLKRIRQVARGKQNPQQRILHGKIADFCKFTEEVLSAVKDDSELIEVINALDTAESFDSLTGSNLIDHLVGRLSHEGVAKWIQTANKPWCFRHICAAFPHWSSEAKVEALTNLLQRPRAQEVQYTVGNCIDSMFKMKVRAGELVNVSMVEGDEDALRQTAIAIFGKDVLKSGLKKMKSREYAKSALQVFWICLKLWSKMASSDEMSEGYASNAEELIMIAQGDEDSLKVLLDLLLGILSQPMKYHRTVVYYVFVQLLPHFKKQHVSHIIETMMMNDDELADDEGSEGDSSNDEDGEMEDNDDAPVESEPDSDEEEVEPETLSRLESALGKAAVKRKGDAIDEEESDASDVDDSEMFAMDDRLAAAFKAMVPAKKKNKAASQAAAAFRLKLADLLLFTISSQDTPASIKIHMVIPLLKLAKLQLKEDMEGTHSKKTISLLNILSRLKKIEVTDKQVISLLDKLIVEGSGISNPTLISTVAALCSFIFSLGISSDGTCSEAVLSAFVGLFERFMTQEDGLIGCELAIAAVIKHPEPFVPRASVFLKAGFNEEYRVFRRTEAVLCLAGMMNKAVILKAPVEKSVVKGLAKASSEYLQSSMSEPNTIKPRFFASVLKLLLSAANSVGDELKPTLQKYLKLDEMLENEQVWNEVSKKVNAACQQVCGKSATRVLDTIQKAMA